MYYLFFSLMRFDPIPCHGFPLWGFAITLIGHTTLSGIPLDERSARRRDLYLKTHNTHERRTFISLGGIKYRNSSKRAAADPRLRRRGHRYRQSLLPSHAVPQAVRRLPGAANTEVRFQTTLVQFVMDRVTMG